MPDTLAGTDLITIIDYPQGASGKFLSLCLCFNDAFHPQTPDFIPDGGDRRARMFAELEAWAERRMHGDTLWEDLRMGDTCFFGVPNFNEDQGNMDDAPLHAAMLEESNGVHHHCLRQGLRFFRNVHNGDTARFYKAVWPEARRMSLVNCASWIALRNQHGLSLQRFKARDRAQDVDPHGGYTWDCGDFRSWDGFLPAYTGLLSWYGLEPSNLVDLQRFHRLYLSANAPRLAP